MHLDFQHRFIFPHFCVVCVGIYRCKLFLGTYDKHILRIVDVSQLNCEIIQ